MAATGVTEYLAEAERHECAGDLKPAVVAARKARVLEPGARGIGLYLAKLLKLDGRTAEAYDLYLELWDPDRADQDLQAYLAMTLSPLTDRAAEPGIEADIERCLDFPNVEYNTLARVSAVRLLHKYPQSPEAPAPDLDVLCADRFLIRALTSIFFADADLERFLASIRRLLLIEVLESGTLLTERIDLIVAVAMQSANSEYVLHGDDLEEQMVEGLLEMQETMMAGDGDADALLGTVLVAAMYMPLVHMPVAVSLLSIPLENWPESVRPLVTRTLSDRLAEQEIAPTIPALAEIRDEVSRAVQAQYEENPYPRWLSVTYRRKVDFRDDLKVRLPDINLPKLFDSKPLNILVAGCGTGRQPISIVKGYADVAVTALDLSRASLAYGMRMAGEMGLDTIDFRHGDILDLPRLDRRFAVIYSSGVLHHMQDPTAGWKALCGILEPGGLMNIGLYSERAREAIVKARLIIEKLGIGDDADSIRRFRHDVLNGRFGDMLAPLTKTNDFYSLSGCRDLIFHVHEHRYTLPRIDAILRDLELEFLGFDQLPPEIVNAYRQAFPDDRPMTNLSNWDRVERKTPALFLGMYNMWFRFTR